MRVLLIKMSSMGDILHTLPALTDARQAISNIEFDWVVEEAFAEIPAWHPAVKQIIPIAWRRWRKRFFTFFFNPEWKHFRKLLRQQKYDYIIDAQGLIKSAIVTKMARGLRCGYDRKSIREPLASIAYGQKFSVEKSQHALLRIRELFAKILDYNFNVDNVNYGIKAAFIQVINPILLEHYTVFIPNTSQAQKRWPISNWQALLQKMQTTKQHVVIPAGYAHEQPLIQQIATDFENVTILPKGSLTQMAVVLAHSQAIVSVDTGLAHLAAAIDKPTITLYGPTDTKLIGTVGQQQIHLTTNNHQIDISVKQVWLQLKVLIKNNRD